MHHAAHLVDCALSSTQLALQTIVHSTHGALPDSIVFHREMMLELPHVADLLMVCDKRQTLVHYSVQHKNA